MFFDLNEKQIISIFDNMMKIATKEKLQLALEIVKKIHKRIEDKLNELEKPKLEK